MVSRKDDIMRRIDGALGAVQNEFNSLSSPSPTSPSTPLSIRLTGALQRIGGTIRSPTPLSPGTPSNSDIANRRLSAPASSSPRPQVAAAGRNSEDPDSLPTYSRHAPPILPPRSPSVPHPQHMFSTRSGRLALAVDADTKHKAPLYVIDSSVTRPGFEVAGSVTLDLKNPETIDALKIRVKGVVKTNVLRINGNTGTRQPISDEVTFLDRGLTLYHTSSTPLNYPTPSPSTLPAIDALNQSTDPSKLQGTFTFPFKIFIRNTVHLERNTMYAREGSEWELPPSFSVGGGAFETGTIQTTNRASIQYYIKLTLSRHGLLKPNDRLFAPLIFLRHHPTPPVSPTLLISLRNRGPVEEPAHWAGRKVRKEVRKGVMFGKKTAWFEIILMLPEPAIFAKDAIIPYRVRIVSSSPKDTSTFPISNIQVTLSQRLEITAQNAPDYQEMVVATGMSIDEGHPEGEAINGPALVDGAVWGKRIRGELKVQKRVPPSFIAPNLVCQYFIRVAISCPGPGNNATVVSPVRLISLPESAGGEQLNVDLPPSYFEVVESDRKGR